MLVIFAFVLAVFYSAAASENLRIISNYPLPKNNINEIYQKTKDINILVDLLKKTGDFESVKYKKNTLYLKRKLRVKRVIIKGNRSFWRREILAITGLPEGYPVDLNIIHNIYIRLKKFYMDNGFPFAHISVDSEIDKDGNITITLQIDEGEKAKIGTLHIYSSGRLDKQLEKEIKNISQIKKGEEFNLSRITAGIDKVQQLLQEKNYFDSFVNIVSFRPSGKNIDIIIFIDLGIKYKIHFEGNTHFKDSDLLKLLTFKENGFNYYQLITSTENIENFYRKRGFLDVKVIPTYIEDFKNKQTQIYFNIYEGERYKIEKIVLKTDLPDIKKEIPLKRGDFYLKGKLEEFIKNISSTMFSEGYMNVHYDIKEKILKREKKVRVMISLIRGKKYVLRSLKINNPEIKYKIETPAVYRPEELLSALEKVKKELKDRGFFDGDAFLDVNFEAGKEKIYVDAVIDTKTGERYKNGITLIYGTYHLQPKVIERNLTRERFYSKEDFDNELDFLYYTSFFDSINPVLQIDRKGKTVNKVYSLHEDKRGSFQGIIGYSSEQKLKVSAAVHLKNLFEYGYEFSGYLERTDLGIFYRLTAENRLLPKRTGVSVSLLKSYQYHRIYDIENNETQIKISRKPNRWVNQSLSIRYADNKLKNQSVFPRNSFNTLKVALSLSDDHRNPLVNPKSGYYFSGILEREFLDIGFNKIYLTGRYYKSFLFFTFTQKLTAGFITKKTKDLPPSERFFLGGISTFRGFGYEKIAGRTDTGGNSMLTVSSELRYPLFPSFNLYGFTFVDIGNVYETTQELKKLKTRKTAGTGIYVPTPVGSFLLDVAFKLDRKKGESLYRIEFSINTLF